ncbi:MAG TPA: nuclear transport factor 2 family protein, partial [Rubrivivax sp.]|nr:nuclear transport factor 2 family protein [Rubrivivax sp.]
MNELSAADVTTIVKGYLRALESGDVDAIVSLYAEDATLEDPVGSTPVVGHAAIRAFYAKAQDMHPRIKLTGAVRVAGRECAFAFAVTVTYQGQRITIHPIDTFRFDAA